MTLVLLTLVLGQGSVEPDPIGDWYHKQIVTDNQSALWEPSVLTGSDLARLVQIENSLVEIGCGSKSAGTLGETVLTHSEYLESLKGEQVARSQTKRQVDQRTTYLVIFGAILLIAGTSLFEYYFRRGRKQGINEVDDSHVLS